MARRKSTSGATHTGDVLPPPPMPPKTEQELAESREICRMLEELTRIVIQQNLDRAVILAQMAARHQGPLVEHFGELGRRYAHLLNAPQKPSFRVIDGGQTDGRSTNHPRLLLSPEN
jgi:hypothetical protein